MQFEHFDKIHDGGYALGIFKLLVAGDVDFVPWLSSRGSTIQKKLTPGKVGVMNLIDYYNAMTEQSVIVAEDCGRVLGFISYRKDFRNADIPESQDTNIYVSTIITDRDSRGKGIGRGLYHKLMSMYPGAFIYTRTWSANITHINLLNSMDFKLLCEIKDDRGKGINTVYYGKRL